MPATVRALLLILALLTGLSASGGMSVQGFTFSGVTNRFITPNGDARNDNVAFSFSNPSDSAGSIKIYDLRGHLLTTIAISSGGSLTCPNPAPGNPGCPSWDARVNGATVATGVYVFVISVENVAASGALVVIR